MAILPFLNTWHAPLMLLDEDGIELTLVITGDLKIDGAKVGFYRFRTVAIATILGLLVLGVMFGVTQMRVHLGFEHLLHGTCEEFHDHGLHIVQVFQIALSSSQGELPFGVLGVYTNYFTPSFPIPSCTSCPCIITCTISFKLSTFAFRIMIILR